MPRKPRQFSPEVAYHVIARGNNRQTLFLRKLDYERFLDYLRLLKSDYQFHIFHYCLMPNHVHLLMKFEGDVPFRKVPHRLFLLYAKYFAREYQHVGHVFQGRFKSLPMENNSYLLECGRYIERNPVKAKIVGHPAEYVWSSASFYLNGQKNDLLTEDPLYLDLDPVATNRRRDYETFLITNRPYEAAVERIIFEKNPSIPKLSL